MASPQQFRWHYAELDDADFQIRGRSLFFFFLVLTSIILLVTFLFLYARWLCNVDYSPPSSTPSTASAPLPRGLDPTTINDLPIVLYRSSDGAECCICLGIFGDGDKVKELPACKHTFHSDCVDQWLCKHSSCPLCRTCLNP